MIKIDFFTLLLVSVSVLGLISIFFVVKGLKENKEEKVSINKFTYGLQNNKKAKHRRRVFILRIKLFFLFIALISSVIIIIFIPLASSEQTVYFFALAAILFGIAASWLFSSFFVNPLKQLLHYAEKILDIKDKESLSDLSIKLNGNDEITILAGILNGMKESLAEAAKISSELAIARELQKKFLPLDADSMGIKHNFCRKETEYMDFFAYYAGARGMSGDYFDFKDLDGRHYAFIKCDIAGKGIPAALLMVQVASLYKNYLYNWKSGNNAAFIENLVYHINDFIESLSFENRFAALTLGIFDSHNGEVHLCSAGDKIIHIYNAASSKLENIILDEAPAAGILPSHTVKSRGAYKAQKLLLKKNDILFLYTDGIEESKRKFRDSKYRPMVCKETRINTVHGNHLSGQKDEEMGHERVEGIINAVMFKGTYSLRKYHNPEGDKKILEFNFSKSSGKVEDAVMGLISLEKIFRIYKNPKAEDTAFVKTDKLIDQYLKRYFLQYGEYCLISRESTVNNAYLDYTNLEEDEQYDDLTVMGIKRK